MNSIIKRFRDEPAFVGSVVTGAIALFAAFGLNLDGEQVATITGFVALLTGGAVRHESVPARALQELANAERLNAAVEVD